MGCLGYPKASQLHWLISETTISILKMEGSKVQHLVVNATYRHIHLLIVQRLGDLLNASLLRKAKHCPQRIKDNISMQPLFIHIWVSIWQAILLCILAWHTKLLLLGQWDITCAILAKVLASNGAMTIISAHLPSSMWSTGSPRFVHDFHSVLSSYTSTSAGSASAAKKCLACSVTTRRTWEFSIQSSCGDQQNFVLSINR